MKVKLGDVADGYKALNSFMENFSFTLRLTHDLGRTLKSCKNEAVDYDEAVLEFQKRFTVKNEAGQEIIDPLRMDDFKKEIKDLREKEVEIFGKPISIKTIESAMILAHKQQFPEVKDFVPILRPALLSPLDWLIVADEEEESPKALTA